jgi:hypothetical protein
VQEQLGHTLRDVYLQMALLGVGSLVCALWLPGRKETLAAAIAPDQDDLADEGLAVAASEL